MITRVGTYSQIKGVSVSSPCLVATTGSITLSGTQTIDGVAVNVGDRVLVKNQSPSSDNGIYIVSEGAWSRAVDMSLTIDVFQGLQVYINSGTTTGDKVFILNTPNPIILGTSDLNFVISVASVGTSGTSGSSGTSGTSGTSGSSGSSGTSGTSGSSGTSGTSGSSGTSVAVSGTTNTLPKFTSSTTIGNSNLINDASGNLGLGVTPSAWSSGFTVLQVKNASFWSTGNDASITANAYYDGSNYRYIGNASSSRTYHNTDGSIIWSQAVSGTAGNTITFTQSMTLTAAGRLLINTPTESTFHLDVNGTGRFSSSVEALYGIFISGSNDNRLGTGALSLLNYSSYNSSANQSITLGLGLNEAVDNNIAYQYVLGVGGNASGQNLTLSSKRNGISDLTILSVNTAGQITINNLSTGAVYSNSGTLTNTAPLITATGGSIVTTGGFKYHTFTSSGTFQVTAGSGLIEVFVLGGGGAGGGDASGVTFYAGGGGSGGGLYNPAYYVEAGSYTVTIGAGGTPNVLSNGFGGDGNNSVFGNITALGGGGGSKGNADSANSNLGRNGGSGGGGGSANGVGGISTQSITNGVAYGNNGATGTSTGGGGGGIGTQPSSDGFGGFGKYILNQANRIGGGGGTGTFANGGDNGRDGGGRGGYWNGSNSSNSSGTAGTANTGGGGGGLGYNVGLGGAGGSGIVIVKYKV